MKIKKILIGIDESVSAQNAAKYGFEMAHMFNAQVGLVNIIEPMQIPQTATGLDGLMGMPMAEPLDRDMELMDIQEDQSENIISRTIKKYGGELQVTHFNQYGATADGILECSKEFKADLIVLGTHQRSGFDRLLMGSVSGDVVRHSDIPVLVVPSKEKE